VTEKEQNNINKLCEMEQDSRKILDRTIITLSSFFIALVLGFIKNISTYLNDGIFLKILFSTLIILFLLTIGLNLYSYHYSIKVLRKLQHRQEPVKREELTKENKRLSCLNELHFVLFICALVLVVVFVIVILFRII
jgi:uncharacterized membrane protein